MSQRKIVSDTKRGRISTKYRKNNSVFFRYGDFIKQCLEKYRIDHDLDPTKTPKLIEGIIREWFELRTIQEFCDEDPDLAIQIRKQKEKQLLIDILYDNCDMREIEALRRACEDILSLKYK